jgi:hypothetical protein
VALLAVEAGIFAVAIWTWGIGGMSTTSWLLSAAVPLAELMRPKVFPRQPKEPRS